MRHTITFGVLLTAALVCAVGWAGVVLPSVQRGLVAHLSFDNPDAMLEDSGPAGLTATNGVWTYNGQEASALPIASVDGACGKAMCFPASGEWWYWPSPFVKTDAATTIRARGIPNGGETVSYSLWIKPSAAGRWDNGLLGLANSSIWIFRRGDFGQGRSTYLWLTKGSKDGRLVWSIANWMDEDDTCTYEPDDLFDGNWHHVVCVYEAKTLTLYYDGALVASKATAHALSMADGRPVSLGNSEIGGTYDANVRRYLGGFDEFKIFNVALTAEEAEDEYMRPFRKANGRSVGTVPSPVTLQLDAGTTTEVRGCGHEYGSLVGAGSLHLERSSVLAIDDTFALTGALSGDGQVMVANLVLGGDATGFGGEFTVGEKAVITASDASGAPQGMTFGGRVILPKRAVVAWKHRPTAGRAVLSAGTLVRPADFTEWTDANGRRVKVTAVGNSLLIEPVNGFLIIVR